MSKIVNAPTPDPSASVIAGFFAQYPVKVATRRSKKRSEWDCTHVHHVMLSLEHKQVVRTAEAKSIHLHMRAGSPASGILRELGRMALNAMIAGKKKRMLSMLLERGCDPVESRLEVEQSFRAKRALRAVLPPEAVGQLVARLVVEQHGGSIMDDPDTTVHKGRKRRADSSEGGGAPPGTNLN